MNVQHDIPERPDILTRANWPSWKDKIKIHARYEGVWEYCDPDSVDEYFPELLEPEKPHISTVRPEADSIVDLGKADFIELSSIVDQYWRQVRVYEDIQAGLQVIFDLIKEHVDYEHWKLIKNAKTPMDQMTVLSNKFKKPRLEDLQPGWERVQKLATKPDVQELFELWNSLFTDCDSYLSYHARRQDAFWDCVETAGDPLGNGLPLASQQWIEDRGHVESSKHGNYFSQPRSPTRRGSTPSPCRAGEYEPTVSTEGESIASQHWIENADHVESMNYGDNCAQPRSSVEREYIGPRYCVCDYNPAVSTGHTSLSPQPGSMTGQSDQCEKVSDDLKIAAPIQQSRLGKVETAGNSCDYLDECYLRVAFAILLPLLAKTIGLDGLVVCHDQNRNSLFGF
ncbi:unnamed protein product [Penicillium glandicola]